LASPQLDKVLGALEQAAEIWEKTVLGMKEEKLAYAHQLHRFEHFSLPQIAKIVRLNSRYIYEELQPNNTKGGRFDPQTLSTLVRIRRAHLQGEKVPRQLISMGIKGGTSYSCLTSLTRISYSAYYDVSVEANAELEQEALKGQTRIARSAAARAEREERERQIAEKRAYFEMRRKEILSLGEEDWGVREIGRIVGANHGVVSKILRGKA
jgi:hypothetical protein